MAVTIITTQGWTRKCSDVTAFVIGRVEKEWKLIIFFELSWSLAVALPLSCKCAETWSVRREHATDMPTKWLLEGLPSTSQRASVQRWILQDVCHRNSLQQQLLAPWNRKTSFQCQNSSVLLWNDLFVLNTLFEEICNNKQLPTCYFEINFLVLLTTVTFMDTWKYDIFRQPAKLGPLCI